MANPFTVQPLGGLQTYQNLGNMAAGAIEQSQAETARKELMGRAAEIMERGNPQEIAQFSMQNPEVGQAMMGGVKFANDATKANMRDSMQRIIAGEDPARVIQERAQMVEEQGGDPSDTLRELERVQQDPEGYRRQVESVFAMSYPREYEAFSKATGAGAGPSIGTYNPRDYTTESFAEFTRTNDPSVLERYASQRSVEIGGVPHVFDPAIGGYRPASIAGAAPESGEVPATVTTQDVARSEAEIAAERERQVTRARGQEKAQSPEAQAERDQAIRQSEDTLRVVDSLLEADLGAITGMSSRVPTVRPESMDLVRAAERLEALLTTENLGIMTGVLTDRDIELIKNIGSGLRVTEGGIQMSEEGARERLRQIRDTIEKKLSSARGRNRPAPQASGEDSGSNTVNWSDL